MEEEFGVETEVSKLDDGVLVTLYSPLFDV